MFFKKVFLILIICLMPKISHADLIINEIMYNPDGTDSGREWVEVYNTGNNDIDLSTYKLLENGVNHKISPVNEGDSAIVGANKYAIIADNPEKFLLDYSKTGLLLDSAFSLNNTGEIIELIDFNGSSIDGVNYVTDWGADGNGNSLQFNGDSWIPADPTPFAENIKIAENEQSDSSAENDGNSGDTQSNSSQSDSSHNSVEPLSNLDVNNPLEISAGRDRIGFINSPVDFLAAQNIDSRKTKFDWSFGDGGSGSGPKNTHTYSHPGLYNVVLNARNQENEAVSRNKVVIREPELLIMLKTSGKLVDIMFKNLSDFEVNIGFYKIFVENFGQESTFVVPRDTIIDSKQTITIPGEISRLNLYLETPESAINFPINWSINYPNGKNLLSVKEFGPEYLHIKEILFANIQKSKKAQFHNIISDINID